MSLIESINKSRTELPKLVPDSRDHRVEAEGGCGVIGVASSIPIAGRHIIGPVSQMCNRGNGKGGGIAVVGCFPEFKNHYAINVGYLRADARRAVEEKYLAPFFEIARVEEQTRVEDYREFPRLEIEPPRAVRYFSRVKSDVLKNFAEKNSFTDLQAAEDEFVYQNTFRLNAEFYANLDNKAAFVLSHGRNMLILKAVGYCEDIARYYQIENFMGNVWIGHQRYPTRGRVWHPGGAHPFIGLDEALVHNGDFANYFGVREYLKPRGYEPLFLTDTEVSVYLFDLYNRVYGYPLEYILEALAPTTEHDFVMLPPEKQKIYRAIQRAHLHGSPDGPWFFIVARNDRARDEMQLIGITDTSMLRPQVFALQTTNVIASEAKQSPTRDLEIASSQQTLLAMTVSIGAIASEKQAIDAFFQSLHAEDARIAPVADAYWNARGGSYSDGGAFVFSVKGERGAETMQCFDKFGREVIMPRGTRPFSENGAPRDEEFLASLAKELQNNFSPRAAFDALMSTRAMARINFKTLRAMCEQLARYAASSDDARERAIEFLSLLNDLRYDCGEKKRSSVLAIVRGALDEMFDAVRLVGANASPLHTRITFETRDDLRAQSSPNTILFIDARGFPPEGDASVSRLIVRAFEMGWKKFVVYRCKGDRFIGCGLGPNSDGVRMDVYGSAGDYLGSGLDGAEIFVHNDAQDQVGQILKRGKIVIYGMVGQTFLYGAKGGDVFVMGNAAGRPLINAVGRVRAIINGTCLDYCAESFMAGAETDGGFVIINGMEFDARGNLARLDQPYPGGNFFSLASGGAGYIADPHHKLTDDQLNEAEFVEFKEDDWRVIEPYLRENEKLFGIRVEELLEGRAPREMYRKVIASKQGAIAASERGE
ncbi:MAG: glutamate synthase [Chloroflexi bacterium]|nr:glutamate synthase [Chloroflexota bacterium]